MLEIQKKLTNSFYSMLSLPATAMGFALSIQISALSWILSTKYNLNIEEVGWVWAAGPIAGILGQPIVGLISDDVWFWGGRRKPFILIGGILTSLMLLALPNIDKINDALGGIGLMGVAIAVALTLDLAINISFNPTRSIIADVTPEGIARTKGYTWMQTISGFFGVVAYLIGAFLSNYILIYLGVFIVLLFSVLPVFFIAEPKQLVQPKVKEEVKETKTEWGELLKIYIAHGFSWIGIQTMFVFMFSYIRDHSGITDANEIGFITGIAFAILNTIGFILPAFVLEPIIEKIGRVKTHLICVGISALGYLMIHLFATSTTLIFIFMIIVGVGWAAIVSLPFAIMTEKINKAKTGFFMGIFNLSVVIPQLIVSLFIGGIIKRAVEKGENIIFIISAIALAISSALWLMVKERRERVSE